MDIGNLLRHFPDKWGRHLADGLREEGLDLPDDWRYRAYLIDLASHLEFLTSARSNDFKRECCARIEKLITVEDVRFMKTMYDSADAGERYKVARALPASTERMWTDVAQTVIRPFAPKQILDLGAGSGRFVRRLGETFEVPVIAVEPSDSMLEAGKRDLPGQWLKGSAEDIPLESESVDLVWMSQVYHHISDPGKALREMHRVSRPGGFLAIRNGTVENNDSVPWMKCFPKALAFDERRLPTEENLIRQVTGGGFACTWWATICQLTAESYAEYLPRIGQRGLSSLIALSDEEFAAGMKALETWVGEQEPGAPVFEAVDLFVFRK
jgi:ubiquinone/menaquinone biosynthesis C-methylase UbiE